MYVGKEEISNIFNLTDHKEVADLLIQEIKDPRERVLLAHQWLEQASLYSFLDAPEVCLLIVNNVRVALSDK